MDHCSAIDLALSGGRPGEIYNVGAHNEKNTLEIASAIVAILNKDYNYNIMEDYIDYVPDRKGHDRRYAIDSAKLTKELGWTPLTSFQDALKQTVAWYMEQEGVKGN